MIGRKKALYICQNPTGIDTVVLLAKRFPDVVFYCLVSENFFNQAISIPKISNMIQVTIATEKRSSGFYESSFYSRMRRIAALYYELKQIVLPNVDLVIYNNDGALQRMILARLQCKKVMLIDGVLSGNEHAQTGAFLKIRLIRAAYSMVPKRFDCYLPSILGISNPDKVLVLTKSCCSYLKKNFVDPATIKVIGFHRQRPEEQTGNRNLATPVIAEVVFIAQSFLWHGLASFNDGMLAEIRFWLEFCDKFGFNFTVRPHPRNNVSDFAKVQDDINFAYSEDFGVSTLFVGISSTYILECYNRGHFVLISRTSEFFKRKQNMFYSEKFPVVENAEQARFYLDNLDLCKIDGFDDDFLFGPEALFSEVNTLLK